MSVDETLEQRGKVYGGSFREQAQIAQQLKQIARNAPNWNQMRVDKREAIEMICTKMSRLLYGDPNDLNGWHDIQGYARLIERQIEKEEAAKNGTG